MTENLKKFLEYASKNEDAAQKMKALSDETDKDTVLRQTIAIAKDAGFSLSASDFEENATGELSEDELSSVAGGKECVCVLGGGGEANGSENYNITENTCACVMVGAGTYDNTRVDDNILTRCLCAGGGYGSDV